MVSLAVNWWFENWPGNFFSVHNLVSCFREREHPRNSICKLNFGLGNKIVYRVLKSPRCVLLTEELRGSLFYVGRSLVNWSGRMAFEIFGGNVL